MLAKLATREEETRTRGEEVAVQWYGKPKTLRLLSEVCLWHTRDDRRCRFLGARGRSRRSAADASLLHHRPEHGAGPRRGAVRQRWSLEVTFEEVRRHLGVETQRQWNDLAIARTTPMLMALFSLVCLMVYRWRERRDTLPRSAAWYLKSQATFSDCLALVRRTIRAEENDANSPPQGEMVLMSSKRLDRLLEQLAATA